MPLGRGIGVNPPLLQMLTITRFARRFGLSRSTLLYYDSIGLLSPSARGPSNYRLYSEADIERMELICVYRKAGLALADIKKILDGEVSSLGRLLDDRLRSLNEEIHGLREQQRLILSLVKNTKASRTTRALDKKGWVAILRATGMGEEEMKRWHEEFERLAPEGHQDFLESLGLDAREIGRIRRGARVPAHKRSRS